MSLDYESFINHYSISNLNFLSLIWQSVDDCIKTLTQLRGYWNMYGTKPKYHYPNNTLCIMRFSQAGPGFILIEYLWRGWFSPSCVGAHNNTTQVHSLWIKRLDCSHLTVLWNIYHYSTGLSKSTVFPISVPYELCLRGIVHSLPRLHICPTLMTLCKIRFILLCLFEMLAVNFNCEWLSTKRAPFTDP